MVSVRTPHANESRHEKILEAAVAGENDAQGRLFETVYTELRAMARRQIYNERLGHSGNPPSWSTSFI